MTRRECQPFRPLISAFVDGDLTADEVELLEQHLASCADCRQVFDDYRLFQTEIRRMPSAPPPPSEIRHYVWQETVEKTEHSRLYRWFGVTGLRLGLSSVAAICLLAIVITVVGVHGYRQGAAPAIAGSAPAAAQLWPVYQPIEINFNKPMDHESVLRNLTIWPPSEAERLPKSWRDNTLVIGADASQVALLSPDTDYTIAILGGARDTAGKALGQPWMIRFHTGPSTLAAQPTTPVPTATKAPASTAAPPTEPAQVSAPPAQPTESTTSDPTKAPVPPTQASTTPPREVANQASVPPTQPESGAAATHTATSTTTPTVPPATPTEAPTAPPTATAPPATPTVTPTTPVPTTPAATPASSATPVTPIPVTGAFGSVYWGNKAVREGLGDPTGDEVVLNAAVIGFQHGTMYERLDNNTVYVFLSDGTYKMTQDDWTSAEGAGDGPGPEPTLWVPGKGFGKIWNADPSLAQALGYALSPEAHLMAGSAQRFAHGLLLYSDQGFIYVLYQDGRWELYPDASGHADLETPTVSPPAPSTVPGTPDPTATATP